MKDYFCPQMDVGDINSISMLGLAHIGDGVYELLTRTMLCADGNKKVTELHKKTVAIVNAPAQAEAAERLQPLLTDDERYIYKRGRNAKVNSVPHKADIGQYHAATGLEALFGWLYLQGKTQRINELYAVCVEGDHGA
ncbi:MAG: ribonuclease III [Clostridiales bacterium]|nr:ribonuclease III [Clostridiales bacterium]MDY4144062.1 ribonuclease III domain-containing protein [Oscillospiraceae bacterium]